MEPELGGKPEAIYGLGYQRNRENGIPLMALIFKGKTLFFPCVNYMVHRVPFGSLDRLIGILSCL